MRDGGQTRREFVAPPPEQGIERERVFASLHERMFGSADPVTVGRFVVLAKIGVGAMGTVFAAYDPQLDRKVALKVLVAFADTDASDRRNREARALARLRHPNVVAVHEVGNHRGERFIAMDLVDGVTLRAWLQTPRSWRATLEVLVQAGSALVAAHAAGIVHRDFKPDNVLVEHGHARVVDFGLSRPGASTGLSPARGDGAPHETDFVVGTPAYMAPEAFAGKADEATDQYSYCATMYEALFGVRPFAGTSSEELQAEVRAQRVQRPTSRRGVPGWLRRAVMRGLANDPAERWPSIAAMLQALASGRRRPLAAAIATAAIGGALAGALAMSASTEQPDRCTPTSTRLDDVWNDDTIAGIGAAFAATKLAYADESWQRTHDVLAHWTDAWSEQHHEACVATYEQGVQSEAMFDARMQCLDRKLDELASLVAVLGEPDATLVSRAVAASNGLTPLDACADVEAIGRELARAPVGTPAPPELWARLARARIARRTGHSADALSDVRALVREAEAADHVELAASAYYACAALEDRADDLDAAAASVRTAIAKADALGDDTLRAEAEILLVSILAQKFELPLALEWVGLARATLGRLGDPPRLRASLLGHEGYVLHTAGRFEEALARRRETLELRQELNDELDPALAEAHAAIAKTLLEIGEREEAREHAVLALELRRQTLGELHPDVVSSHNFIGMLLTDQGDIDGAVKELRIAIDLGTVSLGPDDHFLGLVYNNLGNAIAQGRDATAALEPYEHGIAIFERTRGPDSVEVGGSLGNYGRVLAHLPMPHPLRAIDVLLRARAINVAKLGPDHADLSYIDNSLAVAYRNAGRLDEAAAAAGSALRIASATFGPQHSMVALIQMAVGDIAMARHDPRGAVAAYEAAIAIIEPTEARPGERAQIRMQLARALAELGDETRAVALAKQALAEFLADATDHPVDVRDAEAWLAAHEPP